MAVRAAFLLLVFALLGSGRAALSQPSPDPQGAARQLAAQEAAHDKISRLGFKDRVAAYVRQSGVPCTVKNAADRSSLVEQVEVSCAEGRGYLITILSGLPAAADCLMARTGDHRCELPENRHPENELSPFLTQAGLSCEPRKARFAGIWREHRSTFFEVQCSDASDYILSVPDYLISGSSFPQGDKDPVWLDCLEGPSLCDFTDHAKQVHGFSERMASELKGSCEVQDARYVGVLSPQPLDLYEVSCRGSPGLLLETTTSQHLVRTLACADAQSIKTSCKLKS